MTQHLDLSQQICFSFYSVNRLFNKFYQQALEEFDLTYTQYLVLVALWEETCQPMNELGKQLGLASNTLTPLLKRLEEKELVLRLRPEQDRRQLYIQLTATGRSLQTQVEQRLMTCFSALNGFTTADTSDIIATNQQLITTLTNYLETKEA